MQSIQVNWEDEENNRVIELAVQYQLDASSVAIAEVTPLRINYLCSETGATQRSIGVHRDKGRRVVARQFVAGGGLDGLKGRLDEKHGTVQLA
jgi:hypothetical protein